MEVKKEKKERKKLTLHKHYLVDLRRFKDYLELDESDFGRNLETRKTKIKYNGEKIKALTIAVV